MSSEAEVPASSLEKQQFDFRGQAGVTARTEELKEYHEDYLGQHPELQQVLHEFMQSLLVHKPSDTLTFAQEYFQAHREKKEPYCPP